MFKRSARDPNAPPHKPKRIRLRVEQLEPRWTPSANQRLTTIILSPATVTLPDTGQLQFAATAFDQHGRPMATQPHFTWSIVRGGVGSINSSGDYTGPYSGTGSATVQATIRRVRGSARVTIQHTPPVITQAASSTQNPVTGNQTQLQVQASDPQGASLTDTWSVTAQPAGATTPTFSNANSNNTNVTFHQAGAYTFSVTVTDPLGLSATSAVSVTVVQTTTSLSITPANVTLTSGATQQFTAVALDQFQSAMTSPPAFTWQVNQGTLSSAMGRSVTFTAGSSGNAQLKVSSSNGASAQADITAAAPPAAPTNLQGSPQHGQVKLQWNTNSNNQTGFIVQYLPCCIPNPQWTTLATVNSTSDHYQFTPPASLGPVVEYRVMEFNAVGISPPSNAVTVTSPPAAPFGLTATAGIGQISLAWALATGATSYDIYRATSSGQEGNTPIATGLTGGSFTDSNATGGTTYYYEVTAVDAAGQSPVSGEVSATPPQAPAAPSNLQGSLQNSVVTLQWNTNSSNQTGFIVQYLPCAIPNPQWTTLATVESTSNQYQFTPAARLGPVVEYQVTEFNAVGISPPSNAVTVTTPAAAPTALTATAGIGQINLAWALATGATSYDIYRATSSGQEGNTPITTGVTGGSFTDTNLTAGTTYYYEVTALDAAGQSPVSSEVSATPPQAPAAPSNLQGSLQDGQVTLQWNTNSSNQTGFIVQYLPCCIPNPQWTTLATVNSTSNQYQFTPPASPGPVVEYQVMEFNAVGISPPSNAVTVTSPPAAPTGLTATAGIGQISLAWALATGAATYDIYRAQSPGHEGNTPIATGVTFGSFTDTNVTGGTTYYYEVTAVDAAGQSPMSSEVSATPPQAPAAPSGLAALAGPTSITLSWNAVSGATSYDIYRATSSGHEGNTPLATGVTTGSFTDSNVTGGTTYYYEVTAVDAAGQSPRSSEVSATPLQVGAPTGLAASAGSSNVTLSWNPVSGATSYKVYRGTSSGGESFDMAVTVTSFSDTGLAAFTTYYYQVSAINAQGEGARSTEVSATTGNDWFANNLADPGLQSLARTDFNRDGAINYNDALGLLNLAVTETGTGTMSTAMVTSLQAIASPGGATYLNIAPPLEGLTHNLVDGGPYQSTTAVSANSTTAAQLQASMNRWFLGEDLPTIDTEYARTSGYALANDGTLFGPAGAPLYTDVYQGQEGDCWLLASFAEVAYKQPAIIQNCFTDDGLVSQNGVQVHVWTYEYFNGTTPEYMTLNNYFPSSGGAFMYADYGRTIANTSDVLWAPLLEKAYAGLYGNAYAQLNGGSAQVVLPMETGGSYAGSNPFNSESTFITAIQSSNTLLAMASWSSNYGFVANHDYAVISVTGTGSTALFQLYNPWGIDQPPAVTWAQLTQGGNFSLDGEVVVSSPEAIGPPPGEPTSGGLARNQAAGDGANRGGALNSASDFDAPFGADYPAVYVGVIAPVPPAHPNLEGEAAGLISRAPFTRAKPGVRPHSRFWASWAPTSTARSRLALGDPTALRRAWGIIRPSPH
jgi:fibronectin type 3 domain-containing protein